MPHPPRPRAPARVRAPLTSAYRNAASDLSALLLAISFASRFSGNASRGSPTTFSSSLRRAAPSSMVRAAMTLGIKYLPAVTSRASSKYFFATSRSPRCAARRRSTACPTAPTP